MSQYPTTPATFTTKLDGQGQYIFAAHMNAVQDEISAITAALLTTGFAHGLAPTTTNSRDLGTTSRRWKDLYLSGDATVAGGVTAATFTGSGAGLTGLTFTGLDFTGSDVHSIVTLELVNADIAAAAAIAYSKLSLANSIVNADIGAAAAIAYSKLSLTGSIVNADVSGSAAIEWSKISKTSSSLADLATRSAADLATGTLADARLSSNVPLKDSTNTFTEIQTVDGLTLVDDTPATPTAKTIYANTIVSAWCNGNWASASFDNDFNFATFTYNSAGNYSLTFTNAMSAATSYAAVGSISNSVAPVNTVLVIGNKATTGFDVVIEDNNSAANYLFSIVCVGK